jgi:tetratricopeptide (TPR) repeat protein
LRYAGNLPEAVRAYDRAIVLAQYAPAYIGRAHALLELRPNNPASDFDNAIDADPQLTEAYLAKADYLASKRLWKTMEETLQEAIDAGAGSPLVYVRMSEAQINRERLVEALESAIEGSGSDPAMLEGYLAVGRAYAALEQFNQALPSLETYVAYQPDDPRGWAYLARVLASMGQPERAVELANRALELRPRYSLAHLARAYGYLALRDGENALKDLLDARRYGTETWTNHMALGEAYYLLGDAREALKWLNLAISETLVESRVARGYALRALVYEAAGLTDDALINWRWILDLRGSPPDLLAMAEEHIFELTGVRPTRTPTRVLSPTPTRTASPTRTPTRTASPTRTPTLEGPTVTPTSVGTSATPTRTPTRTPTSVGTSATPTRTPTRTPTPTRTATPLMSPTPTSGPLLLPSPPG